MQFAFRCKSVIVTASLFCLNNKVLIQDSLRGCFFLYFNSNNKADCQIKEVVDTALSVYMNDHNSVQPAAAQISKMCAH